MEIGVGVFKSEYRYLTARGWAVGRFMAEKARQCDHIRGETLAWGLHADPVAGREAGQGSKTSSAEGRKAGNCGEPGHDTYLILILGDYPQLEV